LEALVEHQTTVLETVRAAADISVTFAYGILEETRRHLDIYVSKQAAKRQPLEQGELKTVGQLFTRAYAKWKIYRPAVLKALGAMDPSEIKDLDAAWKALEAIADREKFGGQTG
jgi:hypothetical protein